MYTFGRIMEEVAPNIGTGFSANSPVAKLRVRRAIQRIFTSCPILLMKRVTLYAYGDMLILPEEFRRIHKYRICGNVQRPERSIFEFLEGGPGLSEDGWTEGATLIDRGYSPVVYHPPELLPISILSDRTENNCAIVVCGEDAGSQVRSANGTNGETIQIDAARELVQSRASFKTITSFVKPVTKGYVHLYAIDATTGAKYYLARYSPSTTVGAFRAYRIPGYNFDSSETGLLTTIQALVVLKQPTMLSDDDIVPFDDLAAIEAVARSLDLMGKGKYQEAKVEALSGIMMAKESIALDFPGSNMPDIEAQNFMMGDIGL